MDTITRRQIFLDQFLGFPLRFGGWAISEDILFDIIQFCLLEQPRTILDLGSGASTIALAKYASTLNQAQKDTLIISVDSDKQWLKATERMLNQQGLQQFVRLTHAPITETKYGLYYNPTEILKSLGDIEIDLFIIDGPPGPTQKDARYPAIPIFKPHLSKSTVVFLDDGSRIDEKNIVERWLADMPEWKAQYRPYLKGGYLLHHAENHSPALISNYSGAARYEQESIKRIENTEQNISSLFKSVEKIKNQLTTLEYLTTKTNTIASNTTELVKTNAQELAAKEGQIKKLEREIKELRSSTSFRLGNRLIQSLKSPATMLKSLFK